MFEGLVGIGRVGRRHRLHDDGMIAADPDALCVGLTRLILEKDRVALATESKHYSTPWPLTIRVMSWKATSMTKAIKRREARQMDHRLFLRIHGAPANQLRDNERGASAVERRNGEQVKEPERKRDRGSER